MDAKKRLDKQSQFQKDLARLEKLEKEQASLKARMNELLDDNGRLVQENARMIQRIESSKDLKK